MVGSCGGGEAISGGGGGGGGGITGVGVLAGGVTDTVTTSGGEVLVIITGGGGGGGGAASLASAGVEVTRSGGADVDVGGALVLPLSPPKPCTMLLRPLTPSQIMPSRFSQKPGRSVMFVALVVGRVRAREILCINDYQSPGPMQYHIKFARACVKMPFNSQSGSCRRAACSRDWKVKTYMAP